MEQLCYIIQQIYSVLNILSLYSQDEREELVVGYQHFLFDINDVLIVLDQIVEGSMYWGWKINWWYQPWQLSTYHEQKGLTLQAVWEDRVDFGIELYQDIPIRSQPIWIPLNSPRVLTPIDLDAVEAEGSGPEIRTDMCKVCHIQPERPVAFHEFISSETSSASEIGNPNEACETLAHEEGSDLDSMPELEDEINLDTLEIPVRLIPQGVVVNFRNSRVTFETEQGPPWQEVLAHMLEEQNQTSE